jgi:hypothetical protein
MAICYILWPFVIFLWPFVILYGYLFFVSAICYILWPFGMWYKEKSGTPGEGVTGRLWRLHHSHVMQQIRVARWYIFKPKIQIWVIFRR